MEALHGVDPTILARLEEYAATPRSPQRRPWSVDELLVLLDPAVPITAIVARLGVTRTVVTHEMRRLRRAGFVLPTLPTGALQPTAQMVAIARDVRRGMWDSEAARKYGVTIPAIAYIRRQANIPMRPRRWTERERDILIANQHLTAGEVASLVGRTAGAVGAERSRLIAEGRLSPKKEQSQKRAE